MTVNPERWKQRLQNLSKALSRLQKLVSRRVTTILSWQVWFRRLSFSLI